MTQPRLSSRQGLHRQGLLSVTRSVGKWDQTVFSDGAHYIDAGVNVFAVGGIRCENCVFFRTPNSCQIVSGNIQDRGVCKLWIIPDSRLS